MPKPVAPRTCTWELTDDMNGPRCNKPIPHYSELWCNQSHPFTGQGSDRHSVDSLARMHKVALNHKAMYDFALAYAQLDYRTTVSLTNSLPMSAPG